MKRCFNLIPPRFPDQRCEAIERGLERHGYRILRQAPEAAAPDDVLCTWNLHGEHLRSAAANVKAAGGRVIVAEEGYTRRTWPGKHFALALDAHNGAGRWYVGGPERWEAMGIPLSPWRPAWPDAPVFVTEQRGIGSPEMRSPPDWHIKTAEILRRRTNRPVLIRRHLKLCPSQPPLELQIAGAHALVTWGSSDQVRALIAGVPVFYCAPASIADRAARAGLVEIEAPLMDDALRLDALQRMAWGQWTLQEIAAGDPFDYLLSFHRQEEGAGDLSGVRGRSYGHGSPAGA